MSLCMIAFRKVRAAWAFVTAGRFLIGFPGSLRIALHGGALAGGLRRFGAFLSPSNVESGFHAQTALDGFEEGLLVLLEVFWGEMLRHNRVPGESIA